MGKKAKIIIFSVGAAILFLLFQYNFLPKDSFDTWNLPLTGKIIYLDPGHGGPDGGAESGDTQEKDIALVVANKLRDYLQEQGALVLMTRESDTDLAESDTRGLSRRKTEDLKKRLKIVNESEADLFLSIHLNSIPSPRWSGAQTFYAPHDPDNKRAAKFIQDELVKSLGNTKREAKTIEHIYLLKNAKKPGALVEIGFLSNPTEREALKQEEYQDKVAFSIYKGVIRFFSNEKSLE
ncbi:N-acetylmuramoyl-L-alanine amidase CwlD [Lederbergia wuyishanensis]|uniref:N-acetylmuramoyl-L-alanine amidase n=1 Tax=Lederbergia wuyishanensis TaxID=1347903 RepID=A0ABU0DAQ5_9BACI|nr:N-acetylmuramoyl-L-alanine amidase CwlD [Lederbergia wuyishanensis]MCJ8009646.1 N-acetylmuramoyl-L-alanine amidase CwlD [Lederbergia wuyishanensis]MDQ0345480.1 N-acetylmuramoyl-L-alanine amidase [Lederbergia wuyishanensis]